MPRELQVQKENEKPDQVSIKEVIKQEYIKCASDPAHFLKKYCYISHPVRGRILFNLYPFQEEVLKAFRNHDYSLINKSRQLGISTLVAGYALWMMLFNKDKTILCIATKQATAANMVEKVKFMYANLPSWIKGKKPSSDNKLSLKLANNSQIIATSASSDTGRSYAVSLLIIDEAAFINGIDEIYTSIKPTISTGGGCIALSSPNGVGNWFHKKWTESLIGDAVLDGKFFPILLPWNVHPERDKVWFDKEKQNMSPREIAQEYECDFLSSGNTVIDPKYLEFYEKTWLKDPVEKRLLGGDLWIWKYVDHSHQYIVAADVSRGDGQDYSTFHIIDVNTCEQVAEFKSKVPTREFARILVSISTEYNQALLSVENANIGWDVVNEIISIGYFNFYHSPRMAGDFSADTYLKKIENNQTVPGFTMGTNIRPLVISKMESYIREKTFQFYSKRLLEELRVFIWLNGKAQAMNGYNDDLVMALGMGLYLRDTASRLAGSNIEYSRAVIDSVYKSIGSTPSYNPQNPTHIMTGRGTFEDMSWVLK
jgi:hypothetical protein